MNIIIIKDHREAIIRFSRYHSAYHITLEGQKEAILFILDLQYEYNIRIKGYMETIMMLHMDKININWLQDSYSVSFRGQSTDIILKSKATGQPLYQYQMLQYGYHMTFIGHRAHILLLLHAIIWILVVRTKIQILCWIYVLQYGHYKSIKDLRQGSCYSTLGCYSMHITLISKTKFSYCYFQIAYYRYHMIMKRHKTALILSLCASLWRFYYYWNSLG